MGNCWPKVEVEVEVGQDQHQHLISQRRDAYSIRICKYNERDGAKKRRSYGILGFRYFQRCATQNPTTPQEVTFCQNFASACGPDDLMPQAGASGRRGSPIEQASEPNVPPPRPAPAPAPAPAPRAVEPAPVAQPMAPMGSAGGGGGPMTIGSGTQVGNLAGVHQGTAIDPLSGVNTMKTVNAGPVGVQSGSGVNFGGMLGGLGGGGIPGLSGLGRRKRNVSYVYPYAYGPMTNQMVWYPSYVVY